MKNIYDNGEMVLGNVKNILNYFMFDCVLEEDEETIEMFEFLQELDKDTIVCINLNNGMGYSVDYWTKKNKVKVEK